MNELMIDLNSASGVPFHRQIVEEVARRVRVGDLQMNAPLPGARDLAANLIVSLATVRQAYSVLVALGIAMRKPDGGMVVAAHADRASREQAMDETCAELADAVARARVLSATEALLDTPDTEALVEAADLQRLAREVELASGVQSRLLPGRDPDLEGWDVAGMTIPCREIGGDLYDYIPCPDGRIALAIADVTGKGIPAALLVSTLHTALHILLGEDLPLETVVSRANRQFHLSAPENRFAGLFLARLDPETGMIESVNAGQDPPVIAHANGDVEVLRKGGVLVGLFPDFEYEVHATTLQPGDVFAACTDGVTEARSPRGEEFGAGRFLKHLESHRDASAADTARSLIDAAETFSGGAHASDDRTVLICRREVTVV
ncbi:MAG: SpoIIE family protein phosphatase [Acidobacteriota bacterium]